MTNVSMNVSMKAIEMKVTGCGCAATISHYRRIISIEK
jgi:hypothetical protein